MGTVHRGAACKAVTCLRNTCGRRAEDESRVEGLEVAKAELEERLHVAEARRVKLEARVAALTKQNAALAKQQAPSSGESSSSGGSRGLATGGLKEGLETVKAQLKGYTKGVQVCVLPGCL